MAESSTHDRPSCDRSSHPPIYLGGAHRRPFCEPAIWTWTSGHRKLQTSLIKLLSRGPPTRDLPPDDTTEGPAALYLGFALDPHRVELQTLAAIMRVCRSWARYVRHLLRTPEFDPLFARVLCGLVPESVLHPELATRHRLKGWLLRAEEQEYAHVARLAAVFAHFCNIDPTEDDEGVDFYLLGQPWYNLDFEPFLEDGGGLSQGEWLQEMARRRREDDVLPIATRICDSVYDFVSTQRQGVSLRPLKQMMSWLTDYLGIRVGGSASVKVGRMWSCSDAANARLIALLKLYAPMFPDRFDKDGAAADDDGDGDSTGRTILIGVPCVRRVPCRLTAAEDPWNRAAPAFAVAGKPWLGGDSEQWRRSPHHPTLSCAAGSRAVDEDEDEEGAEEGEEEYGWEEEEEEEDGSEEEEDDEPDAFEGEDDDEGWDDED